MFEFDSTEKKHINLLSSSHDMTRNTESSEYAREVEIAENIENNKATNSVENQENHCFGFETDDTILAKRSAMEIIEKEKERLQIMNESCKSSEMMNFETVGMKSEHPWTPRALARAGELTLICRYCGTSCLKRNMTSVPDNEKLLLKWTEILGEQFLDNVRRSNASKICWSHFENRYSNRRRTNAHLPIKDETIETPFIWENPFKKLAKRVCRYCGVSGYDMTMVPKNPKLLLKWIDILGPVFAENILKSKYNYICLTHFESENRTYGSLPVKMSIFSKMMKSIIREDDKECSNELHHEKNEDHNSICVVETPQTSDDCKMPELENFDNSDSTQFKPGQASNVTGNPIVWEGRLRIIKKSTSLSSISSIRSNFKNASIETPYGQIPIVIPEDRELVNVIDDHTQKLIDAIVSQGFKHLNGFFGATILRLLNDMVNRGDTFVQMKAEKNLDETIDKTLSAAYHMQMECSNSSGIHQPSIIQDSQSEPLNPSDGEIDCEMQKDSIDSHQTASDGNDKDGQMNEEVDTEAPLHHDDIPSNVTPQITANGLEKCIFIRNKDGGKVKQFNDFENYGELPIKKSKWTEVISRSHSLQPIRFWMSSIIHRPTSSRKLKNLGLICVRLLRPPTMMIRANMMYLSNMERRLPLKCHHLNNFPLATNFRHFLGNYTKHFLVTKMSQALPFLVLTPTSDTNGFDCHNEHMSDISTHSLEEDQAPNDIGNPIVWEGRLRIITTTLHSVLNKIKKTLGTRRKPGNSCTQRSKMHTAKSNASDAETSTTMGSAANHSQTEETAEDMHHAPTTPSPQQHFGGDALFADHLHNTSFSHEAGPNFTSRVHATPVHNAERQAPIGIDNPLVWEGRLRFRTTTTSSSSNAPVPCNFKNVTIETPTGQLPIVIPEDKDLSTFIDEDTQRIINSIVLQGLEGLKGILGAVVSRLIIDMVNRADTFVRLMVEEDLDETIDKTLSAANHLRMGESNSSGVNQPSTIQVDPTLNPAQVDCDNEDDSTDHIVVSHGHLVVSHGHQTENSPPTATVLENLFVRNKRDNVEKPGDFEDDEEPPNKKRKWAEVSSSQSGHSLISRLNEFDPQTPPLLDVLASSVSTASYGLEKVGVIERTEESWHDWRDVVKNTDEDDENELDVFVEFGKETASIPSERVAQQLKPISSCHKLATLLGKYSTHFLITNVSQALRFFAVVYGKSRELSMQVGSKITQYSTSSRERNPKFVTESSFEHADEDDDDIPLSDAKLDMLSETNQGDLTGTDLGYYSIIDETTRHFGANENSQDGESPNGCYQAESEPLDHNAADILNLDEPVFDIEVEADVVRLEVPPQLEQIRLHVDQEFPLNDEHGMEPEDDDFEREELDEFENNRLQNMARELEDDEEMMENDLQTAFAEEMDRERKWALVLAQMAPLNRNAPPAPPIPAIFHPPPHRRRLPFNRRNTAQRFGPGPAEHLESAFLRILSVQDGIEALERLEEVLNAREYGNTWLGMITRLRRLQANFRTFERRPPSPSTFRNACRRIVQLRADAGFTTY